MPTDTRIGPKDPQHVDMIREWQRQTNSRSRTQYFDYAGVRYMAVRDNAEVYFVPVPQINPLKTSF